MQNIFEYAGGLAVEHAIDEASGAYLRAILCLLVLLSFSWVVADAAIDRREHRIRAAMREEILRAIASASCGASSGGHLSARRADGSAARQISRLAQRTIARIRGRS